MKLKKPCLLITLLLFIGFSGCIIEPQTEVIGPIDGYAPVYGTQNQAEISFLSPRDVDQPGKIYLYGNYLLVNERKKGIHIFDNTDPAQPENLGFIEMLGNTDMAIKDNVLYADHMGQLVAVDITNFASLDEKGRLPLNQWEMGIPAPSGAYFECIDASKGLVVSWRKVELLNPACYAF